MEYKNIDTQKTSISLKIKRKAASFSENNNCNDETMIAHKAQPLPGGDVDQLQSLTKEIEALKEELRAKDHQLQLATACTQTLQENFDKLHSIVYNKNAEHTYPYGIVLLNLVLEHTFDNKNIQHSAATLFKSMNDQQFFTGMEFLWCNDLRRGKEHRFNEAATYITEALEECEPLETPKALVEALALVRCSPSVVAALVGARFCEDHDAMQAALDCIPELYIRNGIQEYFHTKNLSTTT